MFSPKIKASVVISLLLINNKIMFSSGHATCQAQGYYQQLNCNIHFDNAAPAPCAFWVRVLVLKAKENCNDGYIILLIITRSFHVAHVHLNFMRHSMHINGHTTCIVCTGIVWDDRESFLQIIVSMVLENVNILNPREKVSSPLHMSQYFQIYSVSEIEIYRK